MTNSKCQEFDGLFIFYKFKMNFTLFYDELVVIKQLHVNQIQDEAA